MPILPSPPTDRPGVLAWVRTHLGHLSGDDVAASSIPGGQAAADAALAALDLTGYARRRSIVLPEAQRGATRLSPYIRHGLLPLPAVWAASADAPAQDRTRFRDELLWQEYARHVYARVGRANAAPLRFGPPTGTGPWAGAPWPDRMACMAATTGELRTDGWLVNQTRMWLASQWAVRAGARVEPAPGLTGGPTDAGPAEPVVTGTPEAVWLTAESLGDTDPALVAHPGLPAVFVFDEPLLARLRLSGKRLVFLAEAVAELGAEVRLGDPVDELRGRPLHHLGIRAGLEDPRRRPRPGRPAPVAVAAPPRRRLAAVLQRLGQAATGSSRKGVSSRT